jgi:hypothetical protein
MRIELFVVLCLCVCLWSYVRVRLHDAAEALAADDDLEATRHAANVRDDDDDDDEVIHQAIDRSLQYAYVLAHVICFVYLATRRCNRYDWTRRYVHVARRQSYKIIAFNNNKQSPTTNNKQQNK